MAHRQAPSRQFHVMGVLIVSVSSFSLVQSMSIPVLADIAAKYDTDVAGASWVLTAYLLSASIATPLIGRLGDARGRRELLIVSLAMLSLGSVLAAIAPNLGVLVVARVLQGMGGGVLPLSFGIIREVFEPHLVARRVAFMNSLIAVGMAAGIVVAGPVLEFLGLRGLFGVPAVMTGLAGVAAWRMTTPPQPRQVGSISVAPGFLLATWLTLLLMAVTVAPEQGWLSGPVLAMGLVGSLVVALWIRAELRAAVPVVDMAMMRTPIVLVASVVALLAGFGGYASYGFVPQFVQTPSEQGFGFGASVTESGLILMPAAIAMFIAGFVAMQIAGRIGFAATTAASGIISALGAVTLVIAHDQIWAMYIASGLIGLGLGLTYSCLSALIVLSVRRDQTGVATGMNANLRTLGGAIGAAVAASIVSAHSSSSSMVATQRGYTVTFVVIAGAFALSAVGGVLFARMLTSGGELSQHP